jgi:hypothetical protein
MLTLPVVPAVSVPLGQKVQVLLLTLLYELAAHAAAHPCGWV